MYLISSKKMFFSTLAVIGCSIASMPSSAEPTVTFIGRVSEGTCLAEVDSTGGFTTSTVVVLGEAVLGEKGPLRDFSIKISNGKKGGCDVLADPTKYPSVSMTWESDNLTLTGFKNNESTATDSIYSKNSTMTLTAFLDSGKKTPKPIVKLDSVATSRDVDVIKNLATVGLQYQAQLDATALDATVGKFEAQSVISFSYL
jgi:type 1 fimbria pilin